MANEVTAALLQPTNMSEKLEQFPIKLGKRADAASSSHETIASRRELKLSAEKLVELLLLACALVSILTTVGIVLVLARGAFSFFAEVGLADFLLGVRWAPLLEPRSFGVLPLLGGTLLIVAGSAVTAIPTGLSIAIFLGEYAPNSVRALIKPTLEIMAGIPTVVYGYFALTFVTPMLRELLPSTQIFNAASASIVVGIMILPMVASLCDEALRMVPQSFREAGYSLGATQFEVSWKVVLPAALPGVTAAFILAISRAVGETMAVTLAAGATPRLTINPLQSVQTMTAYIVQVSLGDTPAGTIEYKTIFAVAALLFVITLLMNIVSNRILHRLQGAYR